ncbi:MAG: 50S ribosomal protein L28 [Chloroflexi bacterium]|nr:50S ribosomal protein L28 [Chloroflexota bacterium]MYD47796.1 50S ribosomal protein L28 [Chloroflexota bacterium]
MQCQMCGKAGMTGNNVSHSNRKTKTRWKANVHKQTLAIDGKPTRVKICSRCLRTMYKPPRGPKARARARAAA